MHNGTTTSLNSSTQGRTEHLQISKSLPRQLTCSNQRSRWGFVSRKESARFVGTKGINRGLSCGGYRRGVYRTSSVIPRLRVLVGKSVSARRSDPSQHRIMTTLQIGGLTPILKHFLSLLSAASWRGKAAGGRSWRRASDVQLPHIHKLSSVERGYAGQLPSGRERRCSNPTPCAVACLMTTERLLLPVFSQATTSPTAAKSSACSDGIQYI
jgi:hypothetical protein